MKPNFTHGEGTELYSFEEVNLHETSLSYSANLAASIEHIFCRLKKIATCIFIGIVILLVTNFLLLNFL